LRRATSQRFPSRLEFRGPVSCRNRSWGSPFRGFPSRESRAPLGVASAPMRLSTDVLRRCFLNLITAGFTDSHAFGAVAWFPPTTMGSLFTRRGALPGHPGSKPQNRFVPPASPASKPSSSRESVHDDPSCPESPADPLLGFRLSEAFSCHARGPRTRPGHEDLNMPPSPEGSRTRLEGP
jgi:hypothetical protein